MIYYVIIKIDSRWNKNPSRTFRQHLYIANEKKTESYRQKIQSLYIKIKNSQNLSKKMSFSKAEDKIKSQQINKCIWEKV